jgi:2',3'-cyclic-nucleotide 2'-phosphodiesterase (5'-nucleotidase family)
VRRRHSHHRSASRRACRHHQGDDRRRHAADASVNVQGLRTTPLAGVIAEEAGRLRKQGADLVLLTIHAGGRCAQFDDPSDLASCDSASEIFRLVHDLPRGTLDGIVAGHTHAGLAHLVAGVR